MKKFLISQFNNFKKNWYWYFLWLFIELLCMNLVFAFIDNLTFYLFSQTVFNSPFVFYQYTAVYAFCAFVLLRLSFDLSLYIYSYHIYTGVYNWYKFFREKEKQQKKDNANAYKEYCNQFKNKMED